MKKKTKYKIYSSLLTASVTLTPILALADSTGLPDPTGIKDWILKIVGTLLIAYMAFSLFKDFVAQKWGSFVLTFLGGILVGWVAYFPDSFLTALKALIKAMGA